MPTDTSPCRAPGAGCWAGAASELDEAAGRDSVGAGPFLQPESSKPETAAKKAKARARDLTRRSLAGRAAPAPSAIQAGSPLACPRGRTFLTARSRHAT